MIRTPLPSPGRVNTGVKALSTLYMAPRSFFCDLSPGKKSEGILNYVNHLTFGIPKKFESVH